MRISSILKSVCLGLLLVTAISSKAQLSENDALSKLFNNAGDEINCLSIQVLLGNYPKNINAYNCKDCFFSKNNSNSFYPKIGYNATKRISEDINSKQKELSKGLSLDNYKSSLQTLVNFAVERSSDLTAKTKEVREEKKVKLEGLLKVKVAAVLSQYEEILTNEGESTSEGDIQNIASDDPLGDESTSNPVRVTDVLDDEQGGAVTDWIVWLVVGLAVLSVLMGLLTLLGMRKLQHEQDELKKKYFDLKANQGQNNGGNELKLEALESMKSEDERLSKRLSDFEDILFELKRKIEE